MFTLSKLHTKIQDEVRSLRIKLSYTCENTLEELHDAKIGEDLVEEA